MFRQWTWNLDRTASHTHQSFITICITSQQSSITLVPWPLSWTIIKEKEPIFHLDNYILHSWKASENLEKNYWHYLGGLNFHLFLPDRRSGFSRLHSRQQLDNHATKMWPDHRKKDLLGTLYIKQEDDWTTLKGLKPPIYYTPSQSGTSSELDNKSQPWTKLGKYSKELPSGLWTYIYICERSWYKPLVWYWFSHKSTEITSLNPGENPACVAKL